jgi:hypothetical protein
LASSANSIGSSSSTAWQKPPTISAVASCRDAALLAVEQPLLGDAGGGGLVLDHGVARAASTVGKVCAPQSGPISSESHCVWLRAPLAVGATRTRPR